MASSITPDFVIPSGCSHCSKIEMKEFPCPALAGRGCNVYNSGLPVHPQFIHRSPCQCCPAGSSHHEQICPSIPVRLNTFCNCARCRRSQQGGDAGQMPFPHHPHLVSCNSNWVHPVEVQNNSLTNAAYIPPTLPTQPTVIGHVGMTPFPHLDVPVNSIPPVSYHHHYHHYHYHPHTRNTLHPYSLPFLHPRLRRQPNLRHSSRRNAEEEQMPHNIFSILTPSRVRWDTALDAEQLESVVNFGEQLVDQKPRGLSKTVVENLPSYRITSKDKDIAETRCVICLMDFEEKHQVRILPCLHEYHTKCIDKWLKSNRSCPICRKEIKIS